LQADKLPRSRTHGRSRSGSSQAFKDLQTELAQLRVEMASLQQTTRSSGPANLHAAIEVQTDSMKKLALRLVLTEWHHLALKSGREPRKHKTCDPNRFGKSLLERSLLVSDFGKDIQVTQKKESKLRFGINHTFFSHSDVSSIVDEHDTPASEFPDCNDSICGNASMCCTPMRAVCKRDSDPSKYSNGLDVSSRKHPSMDINRNNNFADISMQEGPKQVLGRTQHRHHTANDFKGKSRQPKLVSLRNHHFMARVFMALGDITSAMSKEKTSGNNPSTERSATLTGRLGDFEDITRSVSLPMSLLQKEFQVNHEDGCGKLTTEALAIRWAAAAEEHRGAKLTPEDLLPCLTSCQSSSLK